MLLNTIETSSSSQRVRVELYDVDNISVIAPTAFLNGFVLEEGSSLEVYPCPCASIELIDSSYIDSAAYTKLVTPIEMVDENLIDWRDTLNLSEDCCRTINSQTFIDTDTVTVAHNLTYRPTVTVYSSAGQEVIANKAHNDSNKTFTVTFGKNYSGIITYY